MRFDSTSPESRNAPRLRFLMVAALLVLMKLWLVEEQDLFAVGGAGHDDQLFIDRAQSLLTGDWLGPYHERTLIKGPFYSFWIAATFMAGIPLLLAQHLLYATASAIMVLALLPLLKSHRWALLLFAVLLFNPTSFDTTATARVIRSGVDPALAILAAACAFAILLRRRQGVRVVLVWALGLGLAMAAFWLNREEAVWILPLVALALAGAASGAVRRPGKARLTVLACILLPLAIWQICITGIGLVNLSKYGKFVVVELKSREFEEAWGALGRAGASEFREYVPVPKQVRDRIYEVSPSFAELRPTLEGRDGEGWKQYGCSWAKVCDDFVGGWAIWAIRQAAARAGHHRSATAAASYYSRLASDVNTACDSGALQCSARRATLAPVLHGTYARRWLGRTGRAAAALVRFEGLSIRQEHTTRGSGPQLELFETLTREPLALANRDGDPIGLEGWAFSPGKKLRFEVSKEDGSKAQSHYRFRASPWLHKQLFPGGGGPPEARRGRFHLRTFCSKRCSVEIFGGSEMLASFPLDLLPQPIRTKELFLQIDSLNTRSAAAMASRLKRNKINTLTKLAGLYAFVTPFFVVVALLAFLAETVLLARSRKLDEAWLVGTAILMSAGTLLALLALLDLTSFPAVVPRYLGAAYPLVLTFTVLLWRRGVSRRLADYWG